MWLYHRVMGPNNADRMANNVDADQTAPLCTVCPDLSVRKLRKITVHCGDLSRDSALDKKTFSHIRRTASPSWYSEQSTISKTFIAISYINKRSWGQVLHPLLFYEYIQELLLLPVICLTLMPTFAGTASSMRVWMGFINWLENNDHFLYWLEKNK